ncbi:MAG: DUF362 domain-containing protein [Anaerolineae bacterium]
MNDYTRRAFLRHLVAGLGLATGGWWLSACGRGETPLPVPTLPPTNTRLAPTEGVPTVGLSPMDPTETATPAAPTATPSTRPSLAQPYLVVARNGEPEEMVRRALAALGGMGRFVKPGDDVIVKPNICVAYHTYEYAATTNPWVVGALVKLALDAGARRVRVMDYPFGGSAEQAYVTSGIQEQVHSAGGQMEAMTQFKFVDADIPEGVDLQQCKIYDDVLKADVVIDVPIAKHHGLARLTLGMKNLMGVIYDRPAMHRNLGQRLADLSSRVRPTLTVVDAVRMLMDHGPTGGSLEDVRQADTLIVSPDIVAADSYAATLFGLKPDDLAYVRAGAQLGLGRSDLNSLKIEEISVGG